MIRKLALGGMLALAAFLVAVTSVAAQEAAQMSAEEQAMMQKWAEYATPGEPHQRLASLAGDWTWTSKWWMAPDAPPEESGGTTSSSMSMDGRYLMENYEGSMMGQPFKGHAITGYDNFRDEYVSSWIDNMGTGMMMSRGTYDPATKTLTMTGAYDDIMTGEKDKPMRGVTTHVDENNMTYEMYITGPDGQEFKTMEIRATRGS
ncbi:hypothetical protein BH18GEM1_BH18GEM1_17140 [soil metagenome]